MAATRAVVLLAVCAALAGCKKPSTAPKVALLLPEAKTARYESFDRPLFEAALKKYCPTCELLYSNAGQDAARQQSQVEAALVNGARVLVIDAVDGASAKASVEKAHAEGATVIAYDRLIRDTDALDAFVAFDARGIGKLQATALLEALKGVEKPRVVMINGAPTDDNALELKKGAHAVLDGKVELFREYDTPDWSPDKAQEEMTQALTALAGQRLDGVYAANDGTAGGVIAAAKAAGVAVPIVTGQDAELAAIQRLVLGEQQSTIYKAIGLEADTAAMLARDALAGKLDRGPFPPGFGTFNGKKQVYTVVLVPQVVTKTNLLETVLKDGFWKREQVCAGAYAGACRDAGL